MVIAMDAMDSRFLELCDREFERQVEQMFEGVPLDAGVLPVIGEAWPFECCDRDVQKQAVVRALTAREWFKREGGGEWSQPLLLELKACRALLNNPGRGASDTRRDQLRGDTACTRDRGRGTSSA